VNCENAGGGAFKLLSRMVKSKTSAPWLCRPELGCLALPGRLQSVPFVERLVFFRGQRLLKAPAVLI
jgi:hypothetical protein